MGENRGRWKQCISCTPTTTHSFLLVNACWSPVVHVNVLNGLFGQRGGITVMQSFDFVMQSSHSPSLEKEATKDQTANRVLLIKADIDKKRAEVMSPHFPHNTPTYRQTGILLASAALSEWREKASLHSPSPLVAVISIPTTSDSLAVLGKCYISIWGVRLGNVLSES